MSLTPYAQPEPVSNGGKAAALNAWLREVPMFAGLPAPFLGAIAASGSCRTYPKDALIVQEGSKDDALYIVLKGRLKACLHNAEGRELTLSILDPGDLVGEMALVDNEPHAASVTAVTDAECFVLSRAGFRARLKENPDLAFRLMHDLCRRLRLTNQKLKNLALMDVYDRVLHALTELATPVNGEHVIAGRVTQQEIANMVGASREMVNRIFRDLTREGCLRIEDGRIVLGRMPTARHRPPRQTVGGDESGEPAMGSPASILKPMTARHPKPAPGIPLARRCA